MGVHEFHNISVLLHLGNFIQDFVQFLLRGQGSERIVVPPLTAQWSLGVKVQLEQVSDKEGNFLLRDWSLKANASLTSFIIIKKEHKY